MNFKTLKSWFWGVENCKLDMMFWVGVLIRNQMLTAYVPQCVTNKDEDCPEADLGLVTDVIIHVLKNLDQEVS